MPSSALPHLDSTVVFGGENITSGGVLIIPTRLRLADVLNLEKLFAGRGVLYLIQRGSSAYAGVNEHLHGDQTHAVEMGDTISPELRNEVQEAAKKGDVIVYVPQETLNQPATLSTVPGAKLDFLIQLGVPVQALYVQDNVEIRLAIEGSPAAATTFGFGLVLKEEQATVANFQESLLQVSEKVFSANPILNRNLAYALIQGLKKHGSKVRVIDGKDAKEEKILGYDKILAAAIVLSGHVKAVTKKERVGILLPPGIGAAVANLAVLFAGKVPVNLNFTAGTAAVQSAIKQADLDHYLTADLFVRKLQTFPWPPNRQLTFIERLLPKMKGAITRWFILAKILPASLIAAKLGISKHGGDKEALLLFTSGSSGEPKGVVLSHRNLIANVLQFGSRLNMHESDGILGCLPMFHSFGCTVTLWFPFIQGVNLITYPTPLEPKRLAELMNKYRVTLFVATPTFLRGYLRGINPELLSSLKLVVTGAEKLPKNVAEAFEAKFGKKVLEGYGLTETSPATNVNLADPVAPSDSKAKAVTPSYRFGSTGQLIPGIAIKITEIESDVPVPIHQSGMIWFKGANIFQGYLKNPKKTEEVIKDGWFRTGDIGRMDSDGFLYVEGRLSRFSKIAGEMVPHETVEEALTKALNLESDATRRIAVVGVPDEDKGEALVLLTSVPGGSVQQEILDLRYKLLDQGMPPLWIPKRMVRVQDIPILSSGKLDVKGCEKLAKTGL